MALPGPDGQATTDFSSFTGHPSRGASLRSERPGKHHPRGSLTLPLTANDHALLHAGSTGASDP